MVDFIDSSIMILVNYWIFSKYCFTVVVICNMLHSRFTDILEFVVPRCTYIASAVQLLLLIFNKLTVYLFLKKLKNPWTNPKQHNLDGRVGLVLTSIGLAPVLQIRNDLE